MLNLNNVFQRICDIRSAPDTMMAGIDYSFNLSLFNRNKEDCPKYTASCCGNGIKFSLADAAILAGIVIAALALAGAISVLCFKIKYRKRFR